MEPILPGPKGKMLPLRTTLPTVTINGSMEMTMFGTRWADGLQETSDEAIYTSSPQMFYENVVMGSQTSKVCTLLKVFNATLKDAQGNVLHQQKNAHGYWTQKNLTYMPVIITDAPLDSKDYVVINRQKVHSGEDLPAEVKLFFRLSKSTQAKTFRLTQFITDVKGPQK